MPFSMSLATVNAVLSETETTVMIRIAGMMNTR